jgi:hypothetical protein
MQMKFVPEGRVLVTVAVDQLSKKRRAAGQSYDDAKNVAWAELRAEFYNRSSLTMVISDAFAILPQHWARDEIALTWLEQGECLLHEDFVYPWPLPIAPSAQSVGSPESIPGHWPKMLRGERAPISMSEHDLQRLMAKLEPKQEAAPKQSGLPGRPTSKHLVLEKLNNRIKANEIEPILESEAKWLRDWLRKEHPQTPQSGQSAIKNAIRETYNNAKKPT